MSAPLPSWCNADAFVASNANWDLYGVDWNSLVQGDCTTADWQAQYPSDLPTATRVTGPITAPDGVGSQTQAFSLNAAGNAIGRGLLSYRFVAIASGVVTASVVLRQNAGGAQSVVLAITDGAATPTVLAQTLCTLASGDTLFTVSYASAVEGTEYSVALGLNWTAVGGSSQAKALASKVRVQCASGAGLFALPYVRYDVLGPATWGSPGGTNAEIVLDVPTRRLALEWIDQQIGGFGSSPGEESCGLFVGPQTAGAAPITHVARTITLSALYNKYRIQRLAVAPGQRVALRSTQMAQARALYVAASTALAVPSPPSRRLVVYGDSIAAGKCPTGSNQGLRPGYAARDVWVNKLRQVFPGVVYAVASGGRQLGGSDGYITVGGVFTPNAGLRATLRGYFVSLGATDLIVEIGTNDWGTSGVSAANFGISYAQLLDDIHADLPNCQVYCLSPISRTGETTPNAGGSTLPNYRTQIASAVSARSGWARPPVYIDGSQAGISGVGTLGDGVHPDLERSDGIYAVVKAAMGL